MEAAIFGTYEERYPISNVPEDNRYYSISERIANRGRTLIASHYKGSGEAKGFTIGFAIAEFFMLQADLKIFPLGTDEEYLIERFHGLK